MGRYLGVTTNYGVLGDGLGESRTKKRAKRDHYLGLLYNMGLNRGVTMNHSDHWAVAKNLYDVATQLGQPVIQAANEFFKPGNTKLYSAAALQVPKITKRAQEIIQKEKARQKAEAERKAREEAERKAREEAERKAREEAERKAREKEEEERLKREEERKAREKEEAEQAGEEEPSGNGLPASIIPSGNGVNPLVIGGAALGTGVLIFMLLRG